MTRIILRALNSPVLIFFVAIGIAIQSSLFASWPLSYLQPDIILITVVWCALRREFTEGGIITLIISEISEIHSSVPQGLHLISYMCIFLIVRGASRFLVLPSLITYSMIALMSSVAWKLIGLFVLHLLGANDNSWKHTIATILIGAGVEGIFSIWLFRWLDQFDWMTFKNARAEHLIDDELQLDSEEL